MYDIYLYDRRVGHLVPRGEGVRFAYDVDAVADDRVPAISLSMPKRAELYGGKVAKAFFANLLPEGAYRRLIAQGADVRDSDSALLGAIGGECPGAIAIWPERVPRPLVPEYATVTADALAQLFAPDNAAARVDAVRRGRLSLPGVQEKTALMQGDDGGWLRPLNGAVTSHILKQASGAFADLLENELFCMTLADGARLPVARVGFPMSRVRVFCAERFDRVRPELPAQPAQPAGIARRVKRHQEDFCQALGVLPARKYEEDGGPGFKACARLVLAQSALAIEDMAGLLRWAAFNYLIGNEDAHAKNLALLYTADGIRLAPHYDLLSTEVYAQLQRRSAMKYGRASSFSSVQISDWKRLAEQAQLSWAAASMELRRLSADITAALPSVTASCEQAYGPSAAYWTIGALVGRRLARLNQELGRGRS